MFKGVERQLEFDKVLEIIKSYAKSEPAKEEISRLKPYLDKEKISKELHLNASFCKLLSERPFPLEFFPDITPIIKRLSAEGVVLGEKAFLDILKFLRVAVVVRKFLLSLDSRFKEIACYVNRFSDFSEIKEELEKTFDDYGNVLDTASPSLASIRKEIGDLTSKIRKKLESFVAKNEELCPGRIVTEREGRYVVLVKPHFTAKFKGLVHDRSSSGQTLYVEPLFILEDNNRLKKLKSKEREEIEKILRSLSLKLFSLKEKIASTFKALVEIDKRVAIAQFSLRIKGTVPEFSEEVSLKGARHPLIYLQGSAVPVDIYLKTGLVITGSNTGGKTVTLKTLGLLSMMAQSGVPIPVEEGSKLRVFKSWQVDIGDEQSIEQSLSTFSAHVKNVSEILKKADEDTLVLLDELGAGTDPVEGSSLAVAVLDFLKEKKAKVVVTTHFTPVKLYAYEDDYYQVASVLFDEITLKPLYKLVYGIVGKSYALEIASRYGMPEEVIEKAKRLLKNEGKIGEDVISALEEEYKKLVEERKKLKEKEKELYEKATIKLEAFIKEIEKEVKKASQEKKREKVKQLVVTVKDRLREFKGEKELTLEKITPGLTVKIKESGRKGKVIGINKSRKLVKVQVGPLKLELPPSQLELIEEVPSEIALKTGVFAPKPSTFSPELKLLGMRGEEAIRVLESFLDDAVLVGFKRVKVVHGHGMGILKRLVREYLKTSPYVKSFRPGSVEEGGDGVTVVELK